MKGRIELRVYRTKKGESRCVRISKEADAVLQELYQATGLPVSHIVSQMIVQGAGLVDIIETEEGL